MQNNKKNWNKSALADKVNKQEVPCDMHSYHSHIIQQPSLHKYSSGMPVSMVVEKINVDVVMVWSVYHCVHGTSYLFTLNCQPAVHSLSHPYIS